MQRGDIYHVNLDPTEGREQQRIRPVLLISPDAFNALTKTPVVLPTTTRGPFVRNLGFAVSLDTAGTRTKGIIRCDQPRALNLAARGGKQVEQILR